LGRGWVWMGRGGERRELLVGRESLLNWRFKFTIFIIHNYFSWPSWVLAQYLKNTYAKLISALLPFWSCLIFPTQTSPLRSSVMLLIIYCSMHFSQRSLWLTWTTGTQMWGFREVLLSRGLLQPRNNFLLTTSGREQCVLKFCFRIFILTGK
jgi:hypothetical protein